jgi:hypothetical protein
MLEIPPLLDMVGSLLVDENADETLLGEVNKVDPLAKTILY